MNSTLFNYFEKPRAIKTILTLYFNDSVALDDLLHKIGGSKSTGMKRIKELVELNLASKEVSIEEPKKIFYKLNGKGVKIAKKMLAIGDDLVEE